jgi:hypothetical protein
MELTAELGAALFWLATGATAWIVALRMGLARFWPRSSPPGGGAQGV